jgi:hypothetical protein
MTTNMETDVLSIDDEVARIGDNGNGFYMVNVPKTIPRLKVKSACQMEVVVVPYKTTCSPRVAPGRMYFFRDYYRYHDLGPAGKDSYFDCAQTFNEKCPITDSLQAAGIKKRSQRMGMFNLFVLSVDGQPVDKLHILDLSYANFTKPLFEAANLKKKRRGQEHVGNFADPKAGSIIVFDWAEETMKTTGTKFFVGSAFDFIPHKGLDGQIAKLMADALDLDAALNKLPYDEAKARFIDCLPTKQATPPDTQKKEDAPARTRQTREVETAKAATPDVEAVPSDAPFDAGWE